MTIDKQALREELSNPAIGNNSHLRKLALSLLDGLEAAELEREHWRHSFNNERFRADKLAAAMNTEHEQRVMAARALITQHIRANGAEARLAELEVRTVRVELPPTFWYEHDDLSHDIAVVDKRLVTQAIKKACDAAGIKCEVV